MKKILDRIFTHLSSDVEVNDFTQFVVDLSDEQLVRLRRVTIKILRERRREHARRLRAAKN